MKLHNRIRMERPAKNRLAEISTAIGGVALKLKNRNKGFSKNRQFRAEALRKGRKVQRSMDRIARLMKDDRDANLVEKNNDGVTVNRWTSTGFLAASATTNETAWCTYKLVRSAGMVVFDNQARV